MLIRHTEDKQNIVDKISPWKRISRYVSKKPLKIYILKTLKF